MADDVAKLVIQLQADITKLKQQLDMGKKDVKGFGQSVSSAVDSVKKNWLALTAATAGVVVVVRKAWEGYSRLENKLREVNTLMGLSEQRFQKMAASLRQMSTQLPQSAQELANALYDIVSAGVSAENALAVLHRSAQAATAGVTDTQTAARAGIAIINAYGREITELDHVYDIMFQTVKEGVLTFPDLAQNLGQILPIARAAGVEFEVIGAAMATLTRGGMPVAVAATGLRNAIEKLEAPTAKAASEMKRMGIEYDGLIPTLEQIAELGLDLEGMQKIVPDRDASRGVIALSQRMGEFKEILGEMEGSAGSMQEAFEEMLKSPEVQAKLLTNTMAVLRDNFIKAFSPAILDAINELVYQFQLLAVSAGGSSSGIKGISIGIKGAMAVVKSGLGIISVAIDHIFLAFETGHRLIRAGAAVVTGNIAEARVQLRTLGNEFVAVIKASHDRVQGVIDTFGTATTDVEAPAWIKTLEQLVRQPTPDLSGAGGEEGTSPAAALLAEMRTVGSQAKIAFAELDSAYESGLLSTQEFYESKRQMVSSFADMEIKYLQQVYGLTEDENEQRQINAQILSKINEAKAENVKLSQEEAAAIAKENEAKAENVKLSQEEAAAIAKEKAAAIAKENEALEENFRAREQILQRINERLNQGLSSLQERHQAELDALAQKHAAEIQMLEEHEATKDEILMAHDMQRQEMAMLADQQRTESLDNWLSTAGAIVGQIEQIYAAAYQSEMQKENKRIDTILANMRAQGASEAQLQKKKEELQASGYKKAKELWEKQKRAQIAMALINAAQAILKGFAEYGPIVGAIMAGLTAVLTGIQIAQISRQSFPGLAKGGMITDGTGPKSDDVHARLSKGEFVSPAASVSYYGPGVYEAMRQRRLPRGVFSGMGLAPYSPPSNAFADGGMVTGPGEDEPGAVTIVNFLDERLLEKYLDSPAGQKAVLNVIEERGYEVRQIVG